MEPAGESAPNLALMRLIDAQFTAALFYGYCRMTVYLRRQEGQAVNPKRVARLTGKMGWHAVNPPLRTSVAASEHPKYPHLLRGLAIVRPSQVWSADIIHVPLPRRFVDLVAVIDWYSSVPALTRDLEACFHLFNHERQDHSLDDTAPAAVRFAVKEPKLGTC